MDKLIRVTNQIETLGLEPESFVIICASYEERSTAMVRRLSNAYSASYALVFLSEEYATKGKSPEHLSLIRKSLGKIDGLEIDRGVGVSARRAAS